MALKNVSLEVHRGKVNAIIGENGAGKSTLMKILSGVYQDFEGRIIFKGVPVHFSNPREAQESGIAIIHQELNLIPYLSITENIFLGREIINRFGLLDKKAMRQKTQALLERLKLAVDAETLVIKLKVGQQQIVEIAKALLLNADVIIMDEPTSAISENEVEVLFGIIEDLKREDKAVVYISHKLDELFRIADRFVILRDGRAVDSGEMNGISHDQIIQKMVGRDINVIRKQKSGIDKTHLLSVYDISLQHPGGIKDDVVRKVSFSLAKGEVLGIFGLMGAGRTELLETIFGLHPKLSSGRMMMGNTEYLFQNPEDAIRAGIALVPEDRKKDGVILDMEIKKNIGLTTLKRLERLGILSDEKESALAKQYIKELQIKAFSEKQPVKDLSGGNQQKVVLAKWLATKPKVLMLDEPTRGIDINAKSEIYKLILDLANDGLGVIVVSSELPEILAISDRILVMAEGSMRAEFAANDASEDVILKAAIPKTI